MSQSAGKRYVAGLDGLRALSVLAVIAYHCIVEVHLGWVLNGGAIGVLVFFVLSGYLITSLALTEVERTGSIRLRSFWLRRAQRLLPALVPVLLVACVYDKVIGGAIFHFTAHGLLAVIFYVGNWYQAKPRDLGALGPTWSLAVEEQFYIVWPLLLTAAVLFRLRARGLLVLVGIGIIGSFVARVIIWNHASGQYNLRIYFGSETNAECLLWGCALAIVAHHWPAIPSRIARLAPLGLLALVAMLECPTVSQKPIGLLHFRLTLGVTVVSLATVIVICAVLDRRGSVAFLNVAWLRWIGRLSYDLYLWHFLIIAALLDKGFPRHSVLLFLATMAIATPLSIGSAELTVRVRRSLPRVAHSAPVQPVGTPTG